MKREIKVLMVVFIVVCLFFTYGIFSSATGFTPDFIQESSRNNIEMAYYWFVAFCTFPCGIAAIAMLSGLLIVIKMKKDAQKYGQYAMKHFPEEEFYPQMYNCNNEEMQRQLIENAKCVAKVDGSKIRIEINTLLEITPEDILWFRDNFKY